MAHEYFHNWTGNRITCRDWFQLCLKEGLTVFREQGFCVRHARRMPSSGSRTVKALRMRQFAEDQGPLAHPVRPSSLHEDRELLHRHDLREGLGGHRHAEDPDRARGVPGGDGPLLRPLGRRTRPRSRPSSSASPRPQAATCRTSSPGTSRRARPGWTSTGRYDEAARSLAVTLSPDDAAHDRARRQAPGADPDHRGPAGPRRPHPGLRARRPGGRRDGGRAGPGRGDDHPDRR